MSKTPQALGGYDPAGERLRDQLEPFAAAIRKIEEETAALGLSADARKRAIDLRSIENGLRAQGVKLTAEEILQLELALEVLELEVGHGGEPHRHAEGEHGEGSRLRRVP